MPGKTAASPSPMGQEALDFIQYDAYYHALERMRGMGFADLEDQRLVIGRNTGGETTIVLREDGTVHGSPGVTGIRLRPAGNRRSDKGPCPFARTWHDLIFTAQDHITDRLETVLGVTAGNVWMWDPDRTGTGPGLLSEQDAACVQKAINRTSNGVAAVLAGKYATKPALWGSHLLHKLLGRDRVSQVLRLASSRATIADMNTVAGNEELLEAAYRISPNALVLWFRTGRPAWPAGEPLNMDGPGEIIAQAKQRFLQDVRTQAEIRPHLEWPEQEKLWEAFLALNPTAVNQCPPLDPVHIQTVRIAALAGTSPSCTVARLIARGGPVAHQVADETAVALFRESRHIAGRREKGRTQAALASELASVMNARHIGTEPQDPSRDEAGSTGWKEILRAHGVEPEPKGENARTRKTRRRKRAAPNGDAPPFKSELRQILREHAQGEIARRVQGTVSVKAGPAEAVLSVRGENAPRLVVTLSPDGSIQALGNGYSTLSLTVPDPAGRARTDGREPSTRGLCAREARKTLARMISEDWETMAAPHGRRAPAINHAWPALTRVWDESPEGWPQGASDQAVTQEIRDAIRSLADPVTWNTAKALAGEVTLQAYNTVARARDLLAELLGTNPGAAAWYMSRCGEKQQRQPPRHPGQVISDVRHDMETFGLEPSSWRTAARMRPETMRAAARLPVTGMIAINAAAQAGVQPSTQAMEAAVKHCIPMLNGDAGNSLREEGPGRNPGLALALLLRNTGEMPEDPEQDIRKVSDYINAMSQGGEQIRATTWNGLRKASERWHQGIRNAGTHRQWEQMMHYSGGTYTAWESLLGETVRGPFTITPLTDEKALYQESLAMEHCVIGYGTRCAQGHSRIFTVSRNGNKVATSQIENNGSTWAEIQTRGKRNHPVDREIVQVMEDVAREYAARYEKNGGHAAQPRQLKTKEKT